MVGDTDSQGRFTGRDVIYFYPGYGLAVSGSFEQGKMKNGRECVPVYVKYDERAGKELWFERSWGYHPCVCVAI